MSGPRASVPALSIIVPVLNEGALLASSLHPLQRWRSVAELIVVDGGSRDDSAAIAAPLCDRVLATAAGRARQMNAGGAVARGEYLLFLHCDTRLGIPPDAMLLRLEEGPAWGFFAVRLSGSSPALRVIERAMTLRSRLTGVATGDQGLFVSREIWDASGGFDDMPLMEDVAFSKRLRRLTPPLFIEAPVTTSSRRWERHGIVRTVLLMWYLRLRYWWGADPARLAAIYRD